MSASPLFLRPRTLEEAVESLELFDEAKVISGGTAMSIMLRHRLLTPSALVSIARLPGLDRIEQTADGLRVGALVSHSAMEHDPVVRDRFPVVAETFALVANARVRHAATVGGVLAESDYASDPPATLVGLDAQVEVVGPSGSWSVPCAQFFTAFYETVLGPHDIVTALVVPDVRPEARTTYLKYRSRSTEDRPCVGVFAHAVPSADGTFDDVRVVVAAAAETPCRYLEVDALGNGTDLGDDVVRTIADGYAERVDTLDDMRGSAWYRTEMVRVWVRRALTGLASPAERRGVS